MCLSGCNVLPAAPSLIDWGKDRVTQRVPLALSSAPGEDTQARPQLSSRILQRRRSWRQNKQVVNTIAGVGSLAKSEPVLRKQREAAMKTSCEC